MSPEFAATIVIGGTVLFAYSAIERRVNQRTCPACGFRGSTDAFDARCPRCGELAGGKGNYSRDQGPSSDSNPEAICSASGKSASTGLQGGLGAHTEERHRSRLGKIATALLVTIPIFIFVADAALVVGHRIEPVTERAIRIVKESSSPIESFSIEQYLNGTLYYRRDRDSNIRIQGWTARENSDKTGEISVEFSYSEGDATHKAHWTVDVPRRKVHADDADARALSWLK